MKKVASSVSTPFWRDKRIIPILLQALFVVFIVMAGYYFVSNAIRGLEKIGMTLQLEFLKTSASFAIGESLISYTAADTYARAIGVGILNTLKVSVIGIILATILGVIIGVSRLSQNWLARKVSGLYVEIIRNTPMLVQIFIWKFAVFNNLPVVKQAVELPGSIYLSNRGFALPWFQANSGSMVWVSLFVIGIIAAIILWRTRLTAEVITGQRKYPTLWAIGTIVGSLLLAWGFTQQTPFHMTYPTIGKFNFEGGKIITTEFAAILIGLFVYTAAYVAEIVRAGIQAVPKGQVEAAKSLGLKSSTTLRLVIFPQAVRIIIPPMTSQYLNLAKNSSLAIAVGYPDLFSVGKTILNQTGRAVEMIMIILLVYLCMSLITALFMNIFNKYTQLVER
jgi:general L-amino acid transport system permease protein